MNYKDLKYVINNNNNCKIKGGKMLNNTYADKVIMNNFDGSGNLTFLKGLEVQTIQVEGKLRALDNCKFKEFIFSGKAEVFNMIGHSLQVNGLIIGKNIIVEIFNLSGKFNLESIIGKNINVKSGSGYVKSIEGDSISILGVNIEDKKNTINEIDSIFKENFLNKINEYVNLDKLKKHIKADDSYVYVDKIIGKNIILKNVIANYVEGVNIELLEGCKIGTLKNKKE